jgi:hypothetical protein
LLALTLPGFNHFLPEVIGVERQTFKQESGLDVTATVFALVPSYSQYWHSATLGASLKSDSWIELLTTGSTAALAFAHHDQGTVASGTTMTPKHDTVEECSSLLNEQLNSLSHVKCN